MQVICHGKFGSLNEAKKFSNGKKYAIKTILKKVLDDDFTSLRKEISILVKIDHPNIIKFFEAYEDEKFVYLVMELCTGGDLQERIIDSGSFTEPEAAAIIKKLLGAVNYLNSMGISHRDIKPEHLLYEKKSSNEIKLVDFGRAASFSKYVYMSSMVGSPSYLAPEIFKGSYNKSCDIWSIGVLIYFMLSSTHPFVGNTAHSILSQSLKGLSFKAKEWEIVSEDAKNLIKKMLVIHPGNRITVEKALQHRWFTVNSRETKDPVPLHILNSLKVFKGESKLWREAMKAVVKTLNNSQIQELKTAFLVIDKSKTGYITAKDLEEAMRMSEFSSTREEIENIINTISYVKEAKINYTEFILATINRKKLLDEEVMWEAFKFFDNDRDNCISFKDLRLAFQKSGAEFTGEEFQEIMAEAELHQMENMDYNAFKRLLRGLGNNQNSILEIVSAKNVVNKFTDDLNSLLTKKRSEITENS